MDAIQTFLKRSVERVYPTEEKLAEALAGKKKITAYLGIDPTGPTLHLGHMINVRKLAALQKLGHKVILLIGDFTAMIGDPTDKMATRTQLTREQVLENCKLYKQQASVFLDFDGKNPAEFKFNSEWFGKMNFSEVIELSSHFTVQQMLERDMFQVRMEEGKPIHLHEFFYPLMQGYDSVALDVDLEIGGNDQTFNMLAGRTLQRALKNREKFVMTNKLLVDPSGKKMGKTEGNMISMLDTPIDMYGKVMSWTDGMIVPGFELCTDISDAEIQQISSAIAKGENPMGAKRQLAKLIVSAFISEAAAEEAEVNFTTVHQKHEVPEEVAEMKLVGSEMKLVEVLVEAKFVTSKTDAKKQIQQGGVKVNEEVVKDIEAIVKKGDLVQKGKRFFVKLV